jgi:hypothetical protein
MHVCWIFHAQGFDALNIHTYAYAHCTDATIPRLSFSVNKIGTISYPFVRKTKPHFLLHALNQTHCETCLHYRIY